MSIDAPAGIDTVPVPGPVLVVGCGLIGTSVALALTHAGCRVHLRDISAYHAELAESTGAGSTSRPENVALVVVAVPPDHVAGEVVAALHDWRDAVVTDVSSVKVLPMLAVADSSGADASRYVGGHPMAGSERSGPVAATAELFEGRAWAVTPHATSAPHAVEVVRALAERCGASVVVMDPVEHDAAVARVSHLPHLLSVLTAAQLEVGPSAHLVLAGQGLRDVTRIAGGDPALWRQILRANAEPVSDLLRSVRADLDALIADLEAVGVDAGPDAAPGRAFAGVLDRGAYGTTLIPGKHGSAERQELVVYVQVPDKAGELARLFTDAGQSGVNIEDLRIDHDPGRPVGVAEVAVRPDQAPVLLRALLAKDWVAHL